MARPKRWKTIKYDSGCAELELSSWKYFSDYINQQLLDYTTYIFRGHGDSKWKLEPTIDRIIEDPISDKRQFHLSRFKLETRGRRGPNPAKLSSDNDWWALGQHHGLQTPLLDWTESPFVALYFAASSTLNEKSKYFSVFAFAQDGINIINSKIKKDSEVEKINNRNPTVKLVRPFSDENSRLVNQRGLFTRGPNNLDLEAWVRKFYPYSGEQYYFIIKINVPKRGVQDCLRYLNRMNINHSTLFPDLTGASEFCNKHLSLKNY